MSGVAKKSPNQIKFVFITKSVPIWTGIVRFPHELCITLTTRWQAAPMSGECVERSQENIVSVTGGEFVQLRFPPFWSICDQVWSGNILKLLFWNIDWPEPAPWLDAAHQGTWWFSRSRGWQECYEKLRNDLVVINLWWRAKSFLTQWKINVFVYDLVRVGLPTWPNGVFWCGVWQKSVPIVSITL